MSEGPSLTALLGLLAIAGYQNRDKIGELLGGLGGHAAAPAGPASAPPGPAGQPTQQGGLAGGLGGVLGGLTGKHDVGSFLGGGINDLVDRFRQSGQGATAESWVNHGPNQPVAPHQLEQAIGPDILSRLTAQTGLSREDLLTRLSREVPAAVDQYTPDGRLPPRA